MITGHFVDAYTPILDGVVRTVQAYKTRMERHLGPSYVIAPAQPGHLDEDPRVLRVFSLPFRKPYRAGVPVVDLRAQRKLASISFDVVHSHSPFGCGHLARTVARRLDEPLVFTLHSRYPEWAAHQYDQTPAAALVLALDGGTRRSARHAVSLRDFVGATDAGRSFSADALRRRVWSYCLDTDCVLVPSAACREDLLAYEESISPTPPTNRPRIEIVRQGIDFPRLHRSAQSDLRKRYDVPDGVPLFLFVGQLAREKELPFLFDALFVLANRGQDFRMLVVGEGPLAESCTRQVQALALEGRVRFVGTIDDKERLGELYAQADLFLFPSLYETQGLVVMEAASCGLPTVGQVGAPGLSDLLDDGRTGFFSPRDPVAYAELVHRLCQNLDLVRDVGERARGIVVDADTTIRELGDLYRDVRARRLSRAAASPTHATTDARDRGRIADATTWNA